MSAHSVEVSRGTPPLAGEPDDAQLAAWLEGSLLAMQADAAAVSLRVVDSAEMAALNGRYRHKPQPTNVLSFPAAPAAPSGPPGEAPLLGDIALCSQVILDESRAYGLAFRDRYAQMLVHGLLHLLGYDHMQEDERQAMEGQERRLLAALGIDP